MNGSIVYQVNILFDNSGIFTPGVSKHNEKAIARKNGANTWGAMGKALNIYSFETTKTYRATWFNCAKWLKANFQLKHIEKIEPNHIRAFLEHRVEDKIKPATYKKEAAALQKMERALNLLSAKMQTGYHYDFTKAIKEVSKTATKALGKIKIKSRAFSNPQLLIEHLKPEYQIVAKLQLEGGARKSETFLKEEQPQGINIEGKGIIQLEKYNAKGGRKRELYISEKTYSLLTEHISSHGKFDINYNSYKSALVIAAIKSGQRYTGSHGFRWNFAQNRMSELLGQGLSRHDALLKVSFEMGHSRASITERYLQ